MNRIINIVSGGLLMAFVLVSSCKKPYDYDKEVAPGIASPEKISAALGGTWRMTTGLEVDGKSLVSESMDITDFLLSGGNTPNITFNADSSFTVDTTGVLINYFQVTSGRWAFDDNRYPTKIFIKDMNSNVLTEISIGMNLLGISPQLNFIQAIDCTDNTKAISYNLSFKKQ